MNAINIITPMMTNNLTPIEMMPNIFLPVLSSNLPKKNVSRYKEPITPPENKKPRGISINEVEIRKLEHAKPRIETKYTISAANKLLSSFLKNFII